MLVSPSVHPLVGGDAQSRNLKEVRRGQPTLHGHPTAKVYVSDLGLFKSDVSHVIPDLVELTHDEHCHPHEVEDAVEEHPEHPGRAGRDLRQIEPETVLGVTGGTVDPPV